MEKQEIKEEKKIPNIFWYQTKENIVVDIYIEKLKKELVKIDDNNFSIDYENYAISLIYDDYNNPAISFPEFYMWWYHIYYSELTEKLIEDGLIKQIKTDNYLYIVSINRLVIHLHLYNSVGEIK